jgi:hypothetical protein
MSNDPYDFSLPLEPLTAEQMQEIHEDPAFLAWVEASEGGDDLPGAEEFEVIQAA